MQTLKYINYNRKSTDSEDKQILSIVAQEEAAQALAVKWSFAVMETINESKSAKIPNKRPGFDRLIAAIKQGKYNAIVCWKLDRLARNMVEGGIIIELLEQGKIQEIRTHDKVYTPNENVILLAVEFGSANQYSRDLSTNVKRGLRKKAALGLPVSTAAYGFINDRSNPGNRKWLEDTDRLEILRSTFQRLLNGAPSAKDTYRWLMRTYYPTTPLRKRSGGKPISISYFYRILRNPVYAGFFYYDGVEYELTPSLRRIITKREYYQIQDMLDNNTPTVRYKHGSSYTGFLKSPAGEYVGPDYKFQLICDCGSKFAYINKTICPKCKTAISRIKSPKYLAYTYFYNTKKKKRGEPVRVLSLKVIELKMKNELVKMKLSETLKRWVLLRLRELDDLRTKELQLQYEKRKQAAIEDLKRKRTKLRNLLINDVITEAEYKADIRLIAEEEEMLLEIQKLAEQSIDRLFMAFDAHDLFFQNSDSEDRGEVEDRQRRVMTALGSNLIWNEKTLEIKWPKWVLDLQEGFTQLHRENPWFEPNNYIINKGDSVAFDSISSKLLKLIDNARTSFKK